MKRRFLFGHHLILPLLFALFFSACSHSTPEWQVAAMWSLSESNASMCEACDDQSTSCCVFGYEGKRLGCRTAADRNFAEGFWFALTLAYDDNFEIDKVVCLNLTDELLKDHLQLLLNKINEGWLPPDEEEGSLS